MKKEESVIAGLFRQEYVDELIWQGIVELCAGASSVESQKEVNKRIAEAKKADPMLNQKAFLGKQKAKSMKAMDKSLDAYQEGLTPIDQLRKRMPDLQKGSMKPLRNSYRIYKHTKCTLGEKFELLDLRVSCTKIDGK
ncbi:MAG: hypothetical protein U5K79_24100 [Cyclobacteriaceae bacterium]|nr:hypothetical protein [Cyclobacteriaceae bacterium]